MKTPVDLSSLLPAIAALLPGSWGVYGSPSTESRGHYFKRADGLAIWSRAGGYGNENRVRFSYSRPRDEGASDGGYMYLYTPYVDGKGGDKVEDPAISCADTKTAEQMARDIERRLIPEAEKVHTLAQGYLAARKSYRETRSNTAQRIADALGQPMPETSGRDSDPHFRLYSERHKAGNPYGTVTVSGEIVTFELRSLGADKAVALAEWLKANVFGG